MFKCCLCGKAYETEAEVVKCVNRCGRSKQQDGVFHPKKSNYSGSITKTSFNFDSGGDTIEEMCEEMHKLGFDLREIQTVYSNAMENPDRIAAARQMRMTIDAMSLRRK